MTYLNCAIGKLTACLYIEGGFKVGNLEGNYAHPDFYSFQYHVFIIVDPETTVSGVPGGGGGGRFVTDYRPGQPAGTTEDVMSGMRAKKLHSYMINRNSK